MVRLAGRLECVCAPSAGIWKELLPGSSHIFPIFCTLRTPRSRLPIVMTQTQTAQNPRLDRRRFLQGTTALALPWCLPRLRCPRPAETLHVGAVGVGGIGEFDLENVVKGEGVQIAALCDVDRENLGEASKLYEGARTFADYRRMLDAMAKDLDAIVVSTPDHMHASIALAAFDLGLHVYCQKPIAHNLRECHLLEQRAAETGRITQMGTQIHSQSTYRTTVRALREGIIGRVREAHLWVSRSWAGPEDGRPSPRPAPSTLDWDLWLGVAAERPYAEDAYHQMKWRGWRDFGSGTLGDMGCHIFDPVFSGLDLGVPLSVVSNGPQHGEETFAADGDVTYEFAATERAGGEDGAHFVFRWTDGNGSSRPRVAPELFPADFELPGAGSFLVGEKGVLLIPHIAMPRLFRGGEEVPFSGEILETRNHYTEWTDACRGQGATSTSFSYAGPLTEAVLMGVVAGSLRGRKLGWDTEQKRFDDADANRLLGRKYRSGWEIPGL